MQKDSTGAIPYFPEGNQINVSYKNNNSGIHYVLWSGGFDSNCLLYELLKEYGQESVVAISFKYPWLLDKKYETEVIRRNAFKAKMSLRGYNNIRHTEVIVTQSDISGMGLRNFNGGLPQAVAWLLYIPIYVQSGSYVYAGYIKGDDLPLYMNSYMKIFEGLQGMLDRKFEVRLPYLFLTKENIIEKIIKYDLYEESWYCEDPLEINLQCHRCHPCDTHLAALNTLKMTTSYDDVRFKAEREIHKITKGRDSQGERKNIEIIENDKKSSD